MKWIKAALFVPFLLCAVALPLGSGQVLFGEDYQKWGNEIFGKLKAFLPGPLPGMKESPPWDPEGKSKSYLLSSPTPNEVFPVLSVSQRWYTYTEAQSKEWTSLREQEQEHNNRMSGKQGADLDRWIEEGNRVTGKRTEVETKIGAKAVILDLVVNAEVGRRLPGLRKVGTLKGYPLYRQELPYLVLAVEVGPESFKNRYRPFSSEGERFGEVKYEVKSLLASANVLSKEEADVALAQQMLEKIDYAGLAKLLSP